MAWLAGAAILILAGITFLCLEMYLTLLRLVEVSERAAAQAREDRAKLIEALAGGAAGRPPS